MKRGGLGRGLDVLLPQSGELLETVVRDISIDEIDPNASQPRRDFDKEALEQHPRGGRAFSHSGGGKRHALPHCRG